MRLRHAGVLATLAVGSEARLPLPELEPGRYEVVARCGPELTASVDVVLHSAQGGNASSSAVLVFFVLIGVAVWQLRRVAFPAE